MTNAAMAEGVVHKLPADLKKALISSPKALAAWEDIRPLARNEWICWTVTVKKAETRKSHVRRAVIELAEGKRRPCCWAGCFHRNDKKLSPSQRWVLSKQTSSK